MRSLRRTERQRTHFRGILHPQHSGGPGHSPGPHLPGGPVPVHGGEPDVFGGAHPEGGPAHPGSHCIGQLSPAAGCRVGQAGRIGSLVHRLRHLVAPVPRLLGPGGCGCNRAGHPHRGGIKTAAALLAGRSENWQSAKRETGRSPSPFLPFVIQCTSFPPSPRRSSARHPWTGPGCVFCPPPGRR